ncbi:ABC transporter substrate-binding protein [Georgenia thermotolerans]|nr:ABC transporter substrate-binding protein [Georgenia thermotolerans]
MLATGALLSSVAACASSEPTDAAAATGDEPRSITVGTMPLADLAPFYLALEEGMFDDAGLDVEVVSSNGGAAQIASVISGDIQITYSNFVSVLQAVQRGLPLKAIRENNRSGPQGIYVRKDSDISAPEDLAGRTIAINSLGNIQELTARAVLSSYGIAPEDLTFVEMPPPDMRAALLDGHIDAAWLVEPFLTVVESGGEGRRLVGAFEGPTEDIPVAGWVTTEQYLGSDQETVDTFISVLDEAMARAQEDPSVLAEVIPTYTEISPELAGRLAEPSLTPSSDLATLADLKDLMLTHGVLEKDLDLDSMTYQP